MWFSYLKALGGGGGAVETFSGAGQFKKNTLLLMFTLWLTIANFFYILTLSKISLIPKIQRKVFKKNLKNFIFLLHMIRCHSIW